VSTDAETLPRRPADEKAGLGANPQYAPTRARAREDGEPRRLSIRLPMPSARAVNGILQGGSLMATAAPAVLTVWAGHQQAANYYRHWFVKYPRLAYGVGHAFIETPVCYLWAWSGRSPVLRCVIILSLMIILRLLGVPVFGSLL
jgi:hypothetical protein